MAEAVTAPIFDTILGPTNKAVEDTVNKNCSDCSVDTVSIPANDLFAGKSSADIVSFLQRSPDVNYLMVAASLMDEGLRSALQAAGLDKVKIFGVAPLEAQVKAVAGGQESGWVADPLNVMAMDDLRRATGLDQRSEERRVGKECYALCRSRWSPYH